MGKEIEIPSETGGVKPIPIEGRMARERERLTGMTEYERKWRAQFLKDQHISHNEPRHVPEIYYELRNPIRRAIAKPLDILFQSLTPILGEKTGPYRHLTGRIGLIIIGIYAGTYYLKYNTNDWTKTGGWSILKSRIAVLPGDPEYPKVSDRTEPWHYGTKGFLNSPI